MFASTSKVVLGVERSDLVPTEQELGREHRATRFTFGNAAIADLKSAGRAAVLY
jgi:hypothetical protein